MTTVAYCAVTRAGSDRRPPDHARQPRGRPGPARADRRDPRRGRGRRRADRPRGPGRQPGGHQVARASRRRACSARSGCGARRRVTADDIARITEQYARRRPRAASTRASTRSRSTSATATCSSAFLSPQAQPAHRRVGREPREPRPVPACRSCGPCATRSAATSRSPRRSTWPTASRGGFWLDESVEFARMLEADGALDALTLTGGSSFENPMYLFRGEAPVAEMAAMFPRRAARPASSCSAAASSRSTRSKRRTSCRTRASSGTRSSMPLILLGGINRLDDDRRRRSTTGSRSCRSAGRCSASPTSCSAMQKDAAHESLCIHCNKCMPTIYTGTRCVLVEPESEFRA